MIGWVRTCVEKSFAVNLLSVFIVLVGLIALFSMDRDLHPPFQFKVVTVTVVLPGASPLEMEKHVTFPLEEVLRGLRGLEQIESTSQNGVSTIRIRYEAGFDEMDQAAETVRSRISTIQSSLPTSIRTLEVKRRQQVDLFLNYMSLTGFEQDNSEHRMHLLRLQKKLLTIDGVVRVESFAPGRNIHIEFDEEKLSRYELSVEEARRSIRQALEFRPVGSLNRNEDLYSVEFSRADQDLKSIGNIVIRGNQTGHALRLKDVAKVGLRAHEVQTASRLNGLPAVGVMARKGTETDSLDMMPKIKEAIDSFNQSLPEGLKVVNLVDGPYFIQQQIDVLKKNGLFGAFVVLLVLMLFLGWRPALMAALGVPIAYLGTIVVLYWWGFDIDLISIIGLILVVGILVDDAIIITEKYSALLSEGYAPKDAATEAVRQLMVPVTGSILTTAVAFAPILIIENEMAEILKAVPIIVLVSLALSWLESFFVLPSHLAHFVPVQRSAPLDGFFEKIREFYIRVAKVCVRWRYAFLVFLCVALGGTGYLALKKVNHDFNLSINSEKIEVFAVLKTSGSIETTQKQMASLEEYLSQITSEDPHIENMSSSFGRVWMNGQRYEGYRYAAFGLYLDRDFQQPKELKSRIQPQIEEALKKFKTDKFEKLTVQISQEGNDESKDSVVRIQARGAENLDLAGLQKSLDEKVLKLEGVKERVINPEELNETWKFHPDRQAMSEYGVTELQVISQIRGSVTPDELMEVRFGGEAIRVYTQNGDLSEVDFERLGTFGALTPIGSRVPLGFLGSWEKSTNLRSILHKNFQRIQNIEYAFDADKTNINRLIGELKPIVAVAQAQNPSHLFSVENANEQAEKGQSWALRVTIVCLALVLLVIALVLGSLTQPLLVGMPIPCGFIGIIWALYLHDLPLGLMAMIGLVGTVGVSVNASLVMVDEVNKGSKRTDGLIESSVILEGASRRLRAILLSALTTLGGVMPMAYGIGGESGFTQPLAFSLGWGLMFATALTLTGIPVFLEVRNDLLRIVYRLMKKPIHEGHRGAVKVSSYHEPLAQDRPQKNDSINPSAQL